MENRIIYKYVNYQDGLKILIDNTLKFSTPDNFSDPFDCFDELIEFKLTTKFIKEHISKGILILDEEDKKLSEFELLNKLKGDYSHENNTIKDIFSGLKHDLWISCFRNCNEITCLFKNNFVPFEHERYRVNIKST